MSAVLMAVLIAILALAVDVGYLQLVRTRLQAAADSAALAGAGVLPEGPAAVQTTAATFAALNSSKGDAPHLVLAEDVELGVWDKKTGTFAPQRGNASNGRGNAGNQANAVRVTCRRSRQRGNPVKLFFGRVLGRSSVEISASAIAARETTRCGRIVGLEWVFNENGRTDSYNSNDGPYRIGGLDGDVCSNGHIENKPEGLIAGNATPGEGHQVHGKGTVTGSTKPATSPIPVMPVLLGDVIWNNDNHKISAQYLLPNGDFLIDGNRRYTLPAGTYYIDGDFTVAGGASVNVSGPTEIYVTGVLDIGGSGMVNSNRKPPDLALFSLGPTAAFRGSANFHGSFFGPQTDVRIAGTPNFFGAVLGKTLSLHGNAAIHYDEALDQAAWLPKRVTLVD